MSNNLKMLNVAELSEHPQNTYFFDDMEGQKWTEFLESVKTSGVIEPIVVTQNNTIVSGHQRVRACKELGISEVPGRVQEYATEDAILKDLLETNVRQRGNINGSALKLARIIAELERIYGIKHGNNQRENEEFHEVEVLHKSQDEIIEVLGLNKSSYHYAKKLLDLIPELQDEIESGNISSTTASRVLAQLSAEDQAAVYASLPKDVKLSQKEVQAHVDELLHEKEVEIKKLFEEIELLNDDITGMVERVGKANAEKKAKENELDQVRRENELARKEIDALNDKLHEDAITIASEYILERDKAVDEARVARERYFKIADMLEVHKKEIDRLQECLTEEKKKNENGASVIGYIQKLAELNKRVNDLETERDALAKKQNSVDPDVMLTLMESAIRIMRQFSEGNPSTEISEEKRRQVIETAEELIKAASEICGAAEYEYVA